MCKILKVAEYYMERRVKRSEGGCSRRPLAALSPSSRLLSTAEPRANIVNIRDVTLYSIYTSRK